MRSPSKTEQYRHASLSPDQMRTAIPVLKRRIEELNKVEISKINDRDDPSIEALEQKIDDTLIEVFGADSIEYQRYALDSFDSAPVYMGGGTPIQEVRKGYETSIVKAITRLNTIIYLFLGKIGKTTESVHGRVNHVFGEMNYHDEIVRASGELFTNGHYANAVEDACKVLDSFVQLRSGRTDISGTKLMQTVFSPNAPILAFNDMLSESDKSEQQGMMHLFSGVILAIRNPRAHNLIQDDPDQALEYIGLINMLLKSLDRTKKLI